MEHEKIVIIGCGSLAREVAMEFTKRGMIAAQMPVPSLHVMDLPEIEEPKTFLDSPHFDLFPEKSRRKNRRISGKKKKRNRRY